MSHEVQVGDDMLLLILDLQKQIHVLENENSHLKQQNANLKQTLNQAQRSIMNTRHRRQNLQTKLKWQFYNDHKQDPTILETLSKRFNIESIPWQLVKQETDRIFIELHNNIST